MERFGTLSKIPDWDRNEMKYSLTHAALAAALIAIVLVGVEVWVLRGELRGFQDGTSQALAAYQNSLTNLQAELSDVKQTSPGLGEFMTTIQLHMGKLWFAANAGNWKLSEYELGELREATESAKALHETKNGVNISNVLDSVIQTQIAELAQSIQRKNRSDFQKNYDETLSACNGCHVESDHAFIHVVRPSAPPVTNQRWQPTAR
jgi:hypothetical protein